MTFTPSTPYTHKKKSVDSDPFKIVIVLDESGSMGSEKEKMIKSINDFINEQRQVEGRDATFTLVKFNQKISRVIQNEPIDRVHLLRPCDYTPSGSTALYDAIGDTMTWLGDEKDVLMVVVTDGQENASQTFKRHQVMNMIENMKNTKNWSYVYLSCDITTEKQGYGLGLNKSDYSSNVVIKQNMMSNYLSDNLNSACTQYRKTGESVQMQLNRA